MSVRPPQSAEFIAEAKDHLAEVCDQLLRFERATGDALRSSLEQMLRAVHSVKGGAGFFGLRNIETLAHRMESVLELAASGDIPHDSPMVDVLLAATDRIVALLDDAQQSNESDIAPLLQRLDELALRRPSDQSSSGGPGGTPITNDAEPSPPAARVVELDIDLTACEARGISPVETLNRLEALGRVVSGRIHCQADDLRNWSPQTSVGLTIQLETECIRDECLRRCELVPWNADRTAASSPAPAAATSGKPVAADSSQITDSTAATAATGSLPAVDRGGTIRVSVELVDQLMNLAGELVLVRNQSRQFAESSRVLPASVVQRLDAVTSEFQNTVLETRMQPVGNLFGKFPRLVRDLGRQLGKQISLEMSGSDVELDKTILDAVSDPLTHLVRNACDHGIEDPEKRREQGKPPEGRVVLAARHFGDQIRVTISDDGRGIDRDAIRRQAAKQGLRTDAELAKMPDSELFSLIMVPGFSTAAQVSEVSGRGVGMDVVKTNLARLGGSVEIESISGQGTTFTLRLPLTLAIMPSLLVTGGGQRYAIPQKDLEELVCVDADQSRVRIERAPDQEVVRLRGRLLPLVRLTRLLESMTSGGTAPPPGEQDGADALVFGVVKSGSHRYALAVDGVLASEEIVVKPMHSRLRGLGLFSGATILGDGRVALILHPQGIASAARLRFGEDAETKTEVEGSRESETETVLLVRDAELQRQGVPVSQLRRLVMLRRTQCDRLSSGWFVTIDGVPTRLVSLSGRESCGGGGDLMFVLLPRDGDLPVGFVVDEVLGTEKVDMKRLHPLADHPESRGVTVLGGRITPIVDLCRVHVGPKVPESASLPATVSARILLVDDTEFFREVAGGYLTSAGYEVVTAENGAVALERLGEQPFDLIVSDLEMPVMDGWAFAEVLRRRPETRNLPLLALTTLSAEQAERGAKRSGFDALEEKLDRVSLLASVARLLRKQPGPPERVSGEA